MNSSINSKASGSRIQDPLNFANLQQLLIQITEEIHRQHKLSLMDRFKDILFQDRVEEPQFVEHISGQVLTKKLLNREARQLSTELASNPASLPLRIQLIRLVLGSKIELNQADYLNLLIQACLPIYIGYITPYHLQICAQVFRLYLKKVIAFHKKKMLTVRSKELGEFNMNLISMQDIVKSVENGEKSDDATTVREIKYATGLLKHSRDLMKLLRSKITIPVDLAVLNHQKPIKTVPIMFVGDIHTKRIVPDLQALLTRKVSAILEVMKDIYPLHSISLKISSRMQEIEEKIPQAFHMEGKIRMEALKFHILKMRCGDRRAQSALNPCFKQVIASYRNALKKVSTISPQSQDVSVLLDFVQLTLFAQSHLSLLEMDIITMRQLLVAAEKAGYALARVDSRHKLLVNRLKLVLKRYGMLTKNQHSMKV